MDPKHSVIKGLHCYICLQSATGAYLAALPPPPSPRLLGQVCNPMLSISYPTITKIIGTGRLSYVDYFLPHHHQDYWDR